MSELNVYYVKLFYRIYNMSKVRNVLLKAGFRSNSSSPKSIFWMLTHFKSNMNTLKYLKTNLNKKNHRTYIICWRREWRYEVGYQSTEERFAM